MEHKRIVLNRFLPYQLVNLAQRASAELATIYRVRFRLTNPQWRVLACLDELGEATPKRIADYSFMDKVKTSRALKALTARGLLSRRPDSSDNRSYWLSLNNEGRALYEEVAPLALDWEENFLGALTEREREDLQQVLSTLFKQLDSSA